MPQPWQVQSFPGAMATGVQLAPNPRDRRSATPLGPTCGHERPAEIPQTHTLR